MKKTLLALAAVAAMGVASAQVTVSGSIAAGVQNTVADTKAKFHLTDADINFSAKEDLGGGMTAKASTSISNEKLRGNGTEANNTKLVLDGGFGTLEYVNKLSGKAKLSAGVSVEDDMSDLMAATAPRTLSVTLYLLLLVYVLVLSGVQTMPQTWKSKAHQTCSALLKLDLSQFMLKTAAKTKYGMYVLAWTWDLLQLVCVLPKKSSAKLQSQCQQVL